MNYRARSAFKLLQLDKTFKLLQPGMMVLDVGAAPGSWCQVLAQSSKPDLGVAKVLNERYARFGDFEVELERKGTGSIVVGVDLLHIEAINGVVLIPEKDITSEACAELLKQLISITKRQFDLILSDMAPNASGIKEMDNSRIVQLCSHTLLLAQNGLLKPGGGFVCKVWDGSMVEPFKSALSSRFRTVQRFKPKASRLESSELYLIAKDFY